MSKTIDKKVVEMEFDNKNFERNVDESMQSIERLKKNLNFDDASKSLESLNEIGNNVKLEGILSATESLQDRFSTLGIIGMEVLTKLTDYMIEVGGNMFDAVFGQIWNGGKTRAMNIEQAKFQLEGLGVAWKDIASDINWGVQDTAYSLDAAAMVASQLTASGVEIGRAVKTVHDSVNDVDVDVDRMAISLRAVSGLAAMTNSDYSEMGRIFATVAGNGRLMGMQLTQIGERGLNAAATMASFFNDVIDGSANVSNEVRDSILSITGGLHVTEEEIRDFTSKGVISFAVFAEAMDEAFGTHAKDANKTLTGILANINAALAKIGADFWTPIVENGGTLVELLDQIRLKINTVKEAIRDALGFITNDDGTEYLKEWKDYVDKIFVSTRKWVEALNVDHIKEGVSTIVQIFRDLFSILGSIFNIVNNLVSPIFKAINKAADASVFQIILHIIQSITGAIAGALSMVEDFTKVFQKSGEAITGILSAIFNISKFFIDMIKNAIAFITPILSKVILPVAEGILSVIFSVIKGFSDIIGKITNISWFEGLENAAKKWEKILEPVKKAIDGFFNTISAAIDKFFGKILNQIDIIQKIGFKAWFKDLLDKIAQSSEFGAKFVDVLYKIAAVFGKVKDSIKSFFKELNENNLENFKNSFANASPEVQKLIDRIVEIKKAFLDLFDKVKNSDFVQRVKELFTRSADEIHGSRILDVLAKIINFLIELGALLYQTIKPIIVSLWEIIKTIGKELFDLVGDILSGINIDTLFRGGIAAGIIVIAKSVKDFMDNSKGFRKSVLNILESFRGVLVAWQNSINADTLKKIAAGVAVLTAALLVMSFLDEDALLKGIAAISMLMVGLVYATKQLVEIKNTTSTLDAIAKSLVSSYRIKSIMLALIELGAAMVLFSIAISTIAKLDPKAAWSAFGEVAACIVLMIASFIILDKAMKNMSPEKLSALGLSFIEFSGALAIFALAMKIFTNVGWVDGVLKGIAAIVGIAGSLMGAQVLLNRLSKGNSRSLKIDILEVADAVLVLALAAAALTIVPWESLGKAGALLSGFLLILSAFQWFMTSKTFESTYFKKTTQGMWEFVGVLAVLAVITKLFDGISFDGVIKATAALAGFLAIMAIATLMTYAIEMNNLSEALDNFCRSAAELGIGIGAAGVGILAFAAALKILADNANLVPKAMAALGTGIIELIKSLTSSAGEIVDFLAEIVVGLVESVIDKLANSIPAIGEDVIIMLSELLRIVAEHAPELVEHLFDIIVSVLEGLSARIGQITELILDIIDQILSVIGARFDGNGLLAAFGFEAFIAGLELLVLGMAKLKPYLKDAIESAIFITAFSVLMTGLMVVLSGIDASAVATNTACIVVLTALMAAVVLLFSNVHVDIASAVQGAIALVAASAIILVGFELIIVIMGAIAGLIGLIPENVRDSVRSGFDFLIELAGKIGEMFGAFAGGIIAGFATKVSEALPAVADNLSLFMTKLTPFLDGLDRLKDGDKKLKAIKTVIDMFLELTGAAFLSVLSAIPTIIANLTGFDPFSSLLISFVGIVKEFYDEIQEKLPEGSEERVQEVIKASLGMVALGQQLVDNITTLNDVAGLKLENFGTNIADYIAGLNEAIVAAGTGISPESAAALESAINIGTKFSEFAGELVRRDDGLKSIWSGTRLSLTQFGYEVQSFIISLNNLSWLMINAGIDYGSDTVQNFFQGVLNIANGLVELQKAIPTNTTLGLVNLITGKRALSLSEFGQNISDLGVGLNSFIKSFEGVTITETCYTALDLIQRFADIEIPESTGLFGALKQILGNGAFADRMKSLGSGLSKYITEINKIKDFSKAEQSISLVTSLGWLIAGLSGIDFEKALGFSEALINIAEGVEAFSTSTENPGYSMAIQMMTGIVEGVNFSRPYLIQLFSNLFNDINAALNPGGESSTGYAFAISYTSGIVEGIQFSKPYLIELFNNLINSISDTFKGKNNPGLSVGVEIASGIDKSRETVITSVATLRDQIKTTISGNESGITEAGGKIVDYLVSGINAKNINLQTAVGLLYSDLEAIFTNKYTTMNNIGQALIINLSDGMDGKSSYIVNIAKDIIKELNNTFDSMKNDLSKTGKSAMESYAKGLLDNSQAPLDVAVWTGVAIKAALVSGSSGSWQVGYDFTQGFINGMLYRSDAVKDTAFWTGYAAVASLKAGTQSHSPSKAAREIGGFVGDGFILGMLDKIKDIAKTAYAMGDSSLESLKDALNKATDYAENNLDNDITIRPVLDLSEIQNGVTGINSILNNGEYKLGSVSGRLASSISLGRNADSTIPVYNDSNVLVAIDTLGTRVDSLNDAISKMRVVLDSGEVVGGISNKMNKRFGEMEFAVARGVR